MEASISLLQEQREHLQSELARRQVADSSEADSRLVDMKKVIGDLQLEIPKVRPCIHTCSLSSDVECLCCLFVIC